MILFATKDTKYTKKNLKASYLSIGRSTFVTVVFFVYKSKNATIPL